MRVRQFVVAGVYLLVLAVEGWATPSQVSVQGRLTDSSGVPVPPGPTDFGFRIMDADVGGTQVWPIAGFEFQSIMVGQGGLWQGALGAIIPLTDSVFADSVRWLEIKINMDALPRVRLVTGPYAHRVTTVDGASGGLITSKVSIGPGNTNTGANCFVAGADNQATADYATVGGGTLNKATGSSAVIPGGQQSTASGFASTVSGGGSNVASNTYSVAGGGIFNTSSGFWSVVTGGNFNEARNEGSTIGGGGLNRAYGLYATISGGGGNAFADSNSAVANYSTIGGGRQNTATGEHATVGGGYNNRARGSQSTIAGGGSSGADSNAALASWATIGGGYRNLASGVTSTIGGGRTNTASGLGSTIGGGTINAANNQNATVSGGSQNTAGFDATVGGGEGNTASGSWSTIGGGGGNSATAVDACIGGGSGNEAWGEASCVPGGDGNRAHGRFSMATGYYASALHTGTFIWSDTTAPNFTSTGPNQFLIHADGGVGIGTNTPTTILTVQQNSLTDPVADAWGTYSSRRWKDSIQTLDNPLAIVAQLEGVRYTWKADGKHDIGLIAEDVGKVLPEIVQYESNGVDALSVDYARLVAVLIEGMKEQQRQIETLRQELMAQRAELSAK